MLSSNLALALAFTSFTAASSGWATVGAPVQAFMRLACFAMVLGLLDLQAHRARGALDDLGGLLEIVRVQVLHLLLGDLTQLGAGDLAGAVAAGRLGARLQADRLLDVEGRRRRLGDEGERLVLVDRDDGRKGRALRFLLGPGVELLAEAHDVDAALTQRRPDGRRRGCRARGHLQLDIAQDLLGHLCSSWLVRAGWAAGRG